LARPVVFVTDSLPPEARSLLAGFEVFEKEAGDADLARSEALICWPSRAKPELLKKMASLRMVQTLSAGVDVLDFGSLPERAQVYSNAGAYTENVAEHVWGLLLGVAKGIHLRNQKSTPRRLRGRTLLVVGCGAIGSEVARLSKSLDMAVIGVSRSFRAPELYQEMLPLSRLSEAMPRADAVVITLPLTNATRGAVDYSILSKAKDAVIIVNVGRGETVPEADLVRWLKERPESRFATDVYWFKDGRESFATDAWELPNFAGSLHVSGLPLGEDLASVKVAAAWNVRRFFESGGAVNHVDPGEYVQKGSEPPSG
jgi:D-3-phosphoglycerate dehydrogenase